MMWSAGAGVRTPNHSMKQASSQALEICPKAPARYTYATANYRY